MGNRIQIEGTRLTGAARGRFAAPASAFLARRDSQRTANSWVVCSLQPQGSIIGAYGIKTIE